ncbi:putative serine esterase-domain-containing protein [Biscogniauxia marginata]|nr:putative serine esterase-domain-containing protein [Biscogniauxia marginata]
MTVMEYTGGSVSPNHLCVLVHGLWGNPNHMKSIAKALRATYSEDELYILAAKRNSGSFTYDGIERGGERVCLEIEEELDNIKSKGGKITKLSIVGYSLGGLVARYAVGLLYAKGILDQVEPVNFTTFASPHLGVRTPLRGWHNHVWNVLGARTLSMSGRQLFTIDDFRETGRPLLAILADPKSIFMSGLKKFKRRTLYANAVNDRSAVYYTTAIAKTDPFTDTSRIKANYIKGYEDVILDPANPVSPLAPKSGPKTLGSLATDSVAYLKKTPYIVALAIFIPVGIAAFLLNSVVQNFRSSRRIQLHETGLAGIQIEKYRMPIWIKDIRGTVEDVYENLNSSQRQSYLAPSDDEDEDEALNEEETEVLALERRQSHPHSPTLALTPSQFAMITALDDAGWRKYTVWIHKVRHSHAAIIVRSEGARFSEGHIVIRHWLKEEFLI